MRYDLVRGSVTVAKSLTVRPHGAAHDGAGPSWFFLQPDVEGALNEQRLLQLGYDYRGRSAPPLPSFFLIVLLIVYWSLFIYLLSFAVFNTDLDSLPWWWRTRPRRRD